MSKIYSQCQPSRHNEGGYSLIIKREDVTPQVERFLDEMTNGDKKELEDGWVYWQVGDNRQKVESGLAQLDFSYVSLYQFSGQLDKEKKEFNSIKKYLESVSWDRLQAGVYRLLFKFRGRSYLIMVERTIWKYRGGNYHWYWRIVDLNDEKEDFIHIGYEPGFADAKEEAIKFLLNLFKPGRR